jgi:hypothetical protein
MTTCKSVFHGIRRSAFECAVLTLVAAPSACSSEAPRGEDEAVLDTSTEAFTNIGTTFSAGMRMNFDKMNASGFPDIKEAVGLAACDYKSLYMVRKHFGIFTLYFSNSSGESFKLVGNAKGPHIACDHAQLMTLDSNNTLRVAATHLDGTIGDWLTTTPVQTNKVDRIQGGDGTFYGVKLGTTNQVFTATNMATNAPPFWGSSIATIGAVTVTGFGAKNVGSDSQPVIDLKAWPRRAFALEASGTVSYNDTLLTGSNLWTGLNFGTERYFALSAAATHDPKSQPNALYGLQARNNTVELNRVRMTEVECHDGIDNDANGLTDGEDWACERTFASEFCASRANGNYCIQRGVSSWPRGVGRANPSLVTCMLGGSTAVKPGACATVGGTGLDTMPAFSSLSIPEPSGYGHWCNAHGSNGTSKLSGTGSDPCAALVAEGRTVVRAGLYSLSGRNNVSANCKGGRLILGIGNGTAPLVSVRDDVGNGTDECIINVSPDVLPVFSRMFEPSHQVARSEANGFVHDTIPGVPASPPNIPETPPTWFNRFGVVCRNDLAGNRCLGEPAYDSWVNEGRPLYAVAAGRVLIGGSRDEDVTDSGNGVGSANQGEVLVEHAVSSGSYQEQFVVVYAHLRKRLVQSGQTVRAGQILGYVGATGATGGAGHVHTGVVRLSNVNAYTDGNRGFGWQMSAWVDLAKGRFLGYAASSDALGWAGPGADPWAHERRDEWTGVLDSSGQQIKGIGTWSIALFKSGEAFSYPISP